MKGFVEIVLDNADRVTSFALLLMIVVALIYVVFAFSSGKVPSPGDYKRLSKAHDKLEVDCGLNEETLRKTTTELADTRVVAAQATVRIEFLESENRRKDGEMAEMRSAIARLQAELDVLRRSQWQGGAS